MSFIVLSFFDSDLEDKLVGVCSYPQYDTPLDDVSRTLKNFLAEVVHRLDRRVKLIIDESKGLEVDLFFCSNENPPDPKAGSRFINNAFGLSLDYFYKEQNGTTPATPDGT